MMKRESKNEQPVDSLLLIGLLLFVVYTITNRFFFTIPNVAAYPWMIISCICMLVGAFRCGKNLGKYSKK